MCKPNDGFNSPNEVFPTKAIHLAKRNLQQPLISENEEKSYLPGTRNLPEWCPCTVTVLDSVLQCPTSFIT